MRLRISIRGRVRPSVRPSVGPSVGWSVPSYFRTPNMAVFEGKKSSNDTLINDTMSDDEEVTSDVPPRYLLPSKMVIFVVRKYHGTDGPTETVASEKSRFFLKICNCKN